jgi:hypothetical protein
MSIGTVASARGGSSIVCRPVRASGRPSSRCFVRMFDRRLPWSHGPRLSSIYPVNTSTVGDLLIEVAIVEKLSAPGDPALTRAVAGPFKVKGHVTVEPGYTMQFDMLLKNVSSECACVATVRVVSARTIVDLDQ